MAPLTHGAARALAARAAAAALGHIPLHEAQHLESEAALWTAAHCRAALSILVARASCSVFLEKGWQALQMAGFKDDCDVVCQ